MKKIALLLFVLTQSIFFGQQENFEKILGKKNIKTLDSLIYDFENETLKVKYPNLKITESYKHFLSDIIKTGSIKNQKIYPESNLKLNIYCVPDFKRILPRKNGKGEKIIVKNKCLNPNNEFIYKELIIYCCKDKQKTMELFESTKKNYQINVSGKFLKALESIKNKSEFIKYYIDTANLTASPMSSHLMSEYILKNNLDTDDYFIKRLLFINIVYR